jgi:GxxExxY protein
MDEKVKLDRITESIIGAAIEVHRNLGPGLLESAYQTCLMYELIQSGHKVEKEKPLPVFYKQIHMECGYRLDLVVDDAVIVELKSIDRIMPIHEAQLMSYLKLSGMKVGLLINFNVNTLVKGLRRRVNGYPDALN